MLCRARQASSVFIRLLRPLEPDRKLLHLRAKTCCSASDPLMPQNLTMPDTLLLLKMSFACSVSLVLTVVLIPIYYYRVIWQEYIREHLLLSD